MLIKQLFRGKDYRDTLRRRLWLFLFMDIIGILLVVLSLTVVKHSALSDHVQGFYLGAGCGLILCGVYFIFSHLRLLKNPAAAKKAEISEQDEREQAIIKAAINTVFWVLYLALIAGVFIAFPLNPTVFWTLAVIMILMTVSLFLAQAWHKRHM